MIYLLHLSQLHRFLFMKLHLVCISAKPCRVDIPNGLLSNSCQAFVGSSCEYSCDEGFQKRTDQPMISCEPSTAWNYQTWSTSPHALCTSEKKINKHTSSVYKEHNHIIAGCYIGEQTFNYSIVLIWYGDKILHVFNYELLSTQRSVVFANYRYCVNIIWLLR